MLSSPRDDLSSSGTTVKNSCTPSHEQFERSSWMMCLDARLMLVISCTMEAGKLVIQCIIIVIKAFFLDREE